MSKSTKKSIKYMYISYFCLNQDNLYVNSTISITSISLIFESGIYVWKWLKIVQKYGEKVVARYDPHRNLNEGSKVGNYGDYKLRSYFQGHGHTFVVHK